MGPLIERAICSIKFKADIESLNTDAVLSKIPRIEKKNAMKPYFTLTCDVFFPTLSNCELEYMYSSVDDDIFLRKSKLEGGTIWQ